MFSPWWLELPVALLILIGGGLSLVAAIGLDRMDNFFLRMHPPTLIYTGGAWSTALASVLYFSVAGHTLQLRAWVLIIILAIAAPISTLMLSRAALFRARTQGIGRDIPPALRPARPQPPADHKPESASP